jgi:hypothetical protein
MDIRHGLRGTLITLVLSFSACTGEEVPPPAAAATPLDACLAEVESGRRILLAARECRALCEAEQPDRVACGAMALAYLQDLVFEVAKYTVHLRPSQSPVATFADEAQHELASYRTHIDLEPLIDTYLSTILRDMRGIRDGVNGFVARVSGETHMPRVVPISELPLDAGLVAFIYNRPESFAIKGEWGEKEMASLGAAINLALAGIDLILSQDLNVQGYEDLDFGSSAASMIQGVVRIADASRSLLKVKKPGLVLDARHETHAFFSLLAGRPNALDQVSPATPGLLALIEEEFELQGRSSERAVFQLSDIDGDGTLSRGDAMKFTLLLNGKDVDLAFPYPISAKLTASLFDFLKANRTNMDGESGPANVAPLINTAIREFSSVVSGFNTFPDVIAVDFDGLYDNFTGFRSMLPYWYRDTSPMGVNPYYFPQGVSDSAGNKTVNWFIAYEWEEADATHFDWTKDDVAGFDWREFATGPDGFGKDGIVILSDGQTGHYILWQDPSFANFLHLNMTPFVQTKRYGMLPALDTKGAFEVADNLTLNALTNALIIWSGL